MANVVALPQRKSTLEIQREMKLHGKRGNVFVRIRRERDVLPWRVWYVVEIHHWRFNDPEEHPIEEHRLSVRGLVPELVVAAQERAIHEQALFDLRNETGEPDELFMYPVQYLVQNVT